MNTRQQDKQNYEQQHPNSQANPQQDKQNVSQERSSGGYSSQSLDSEKQSRESGSAQSRHYGSSGSNWGGSHSLGGYGGGGRSWAEVVATAEGEGSSKRDCLAIIRELLLFCRLLRKRQGGDHPFPRGMVAGFRCNSHTEATRRRSPRSKWRPMALSKSSGSSVRLTAACTSTPIRSKHRFRVERFSG